MKNNKGDNQTLIKSNKDFFLEGKQISILNDTHVRIFLLLQCFVILAFTLLIPLLRWFEIIIVIIIDYNRLAIIIVKEEINISVDKNMTVHAVTGPLLMTNRCDEACHNIE